MFCIFIQKVQMQHLNRRKETKKEILLKWVQHRAAWIFVRWWWNEVINACKFIKENGEVQFRRVGRICDFSVSAGCRDCIRSRVRYQIKWMTRNTECRGDANAIFSVFRYPWLDSPVDPTASAVITTRERRCGARSFCFSFKNHFDFRWARVQRERVARGYLVLPLPLRWSLLLLSQMSVRFLIQSTHSYLSRLTRNSNLLM